MNTINNLARVELAKIKGKTDKADQHEEVETLTTLDVDMNEGESDISDTEEEDDTSQEIDEDEAIKIFVNQSTLKSITPAAGIPSSILGLAKIDAVEFDTIWQELDRGKFEDYLNEAGSEGKYDDSVYGLFYNVLLVAYGEKITNTETLGFIELVLSLLLTHKINSARALEWLTRCLTSQQNIPIQNKAENKRKLLAFLDTKFTKIRKTEEGDVSIARQDKYELMFGSKHTKLLHDVFEPFTNLHKILNAVSMRVEDISFKSIDKTQIKGKHEDKQPCLSLKLSKPMLVPMFLCDKRNNSNINFLNTSTAVASAILTELEETLDLDPKLQAHMQKGEAKFFEDVQLGNMKDTNILKINHLDDNVYVLEPWNEKVLNNANQLYVCLTHIILKYIPQHSKIQIRAYPKALSLPKCKETVHMIDFQASEINQKIRNM